MSVTMKAVVTRNSNGSVDLRTTENETGINLITLHAVSNLGSKRFAVDDVVDVSIEKAKDAAPVKETPATRAAKRAKDRADKKAADATRAARVQKAADDEARAAAAEGKR